jgi:oligopeptide/dipeptide ABC transporter ATP-binding protein
MADPLLEVSDLKIHFFTDEGVVKAVDGVNLTVERGKTLCLVGESGCGKSVTSRAFMQIIRKPGKIVSGEILFRRKRDDNTEEIVDLAKFDPKGRPIRQIRGKEIAMIFQEPMTSLSLMHTVGDQITEMVRLHTNATKREARERGIEMLQQVGIPKPERLIDEYPFRLSGGMRQRAMIAMALSCNPTMLIADEPTTALDVTTQAQILDLMLELQSDYGMALLFITHDLGVVAEIADDVAVMYLGQIVERSDANTVFNEPKHPYTQALLVRLRRDAATMEPIKGMVPSPFRRPTGCPFHPRCVQRFDLCDQVEPASTRIDDNHDVCCLLFEDAHARALNAEAVSHG